MRKRTVLGIGTLLVVGGLLAGCTWFGPQSLNSPLSVNGPEQDYILTFKTNPNHVEGLIEAAGGSVRAVLDEVDAVLVTASPDALAAIEGLAGFPQRSPM